MISDSLMFSANAIHKDVVERSKAVHCIEISILPNGKYRTGGIRAEIELLNDTFTLEHNIEREFSLDVQILASAIDILARVGITRVSASELFMKEVVKNKKYVVVLLPKQKKGK